MIRLSYTCTACDFSTLVLRDGQEHADRTFHTLRIGGTLTAESPVSNPTAISDAARAKAREAEILRAARDRNLMPSRRNETSWRTKP